MELLANKVYHAPSFTLNPGDDTLAFPELTDTRKGQMLADYPETFAEIEDVEAYLADKAAARTAKAEELAAVVPVEEKVNNPFATDPASLMTAADRFEKTTSEQAVAAKAPTAVEKRAATLAAKKVAAEAPAAVVPAAVVPAAVVPAAVVPAAVVPAAGGPEF